MISKEVVRYKDAEMRVTRHGGTCASRVSAAVVEVSCIPINFKRDTLVMLFENTKRSGGGEIGYVDYVPESGRARITFKDAAGMCLIMFC